MKATHLCSTLAVITTLLLSFVSLPAAAETISRADAFAQNPNAQPYLGKIETSILDALSPGSVTRADGSSYPLTTDFLVWMTEQADLSPAGGLVSKAEKGKYVYDILRNTAERSQRSLRAYLDQQGIGYRSLYITNSIFVPRGDMLLVLALAARPDVARITGNAIIQTAQPLFKRIGPDSPTEIEPNITFINSDDAWALGATGHGTVLAAIDTGIQWDHPALIDHYRGWDGVSADHNYNWWDATGQYPNAPGDGHGHGTMVTGVMVGGEGDANQIGVAPGAKTIHCKAINDYGSATDQDLLECFQWMLAPWDLGGANPRPDLAPDALNNSWGTQAGYDGFEVAIDTLQMAGILVEAAVGGSGPSCATVGSPADYDQVLSTGGIDHTGGVLPGTLTFFSARGPSTHDPWAFIPDVMAPSIEIHSSYPGDDYAVWSGTSLAGPHVTGLVGLIWSANPILRGNIYDTDQIIYDTAVPLTGQMGSNCGGDYTTGPNNDWGYGTIDALAAVQQAMAYGEAGIMQGLVSDVNTAEPIGGVEILADGDQEWTTSTNGLGLYSLVVPSGTFTVSAAYSGYYTEVITGETVISGEVTVQNFQLVPLPATISGLVIDADTGYPLPGVNIMAAGNQEWITTTNHLGLYSLDVLSGTYLMAAWQANYEIEVITGLMVMNGESIHQDFALQPLRVTISGTVTDANTAGILAAEVQVNTGLITTTFTNPATGIYSLTLAVNHTYTLTAQTPGYGMVTVLTEVLNGNTRQDFNLPAGWLSVYPPVLEIGLFPGEKLTAPITLTNSGGLSLTYAPSSTVSWLVVSPDAGVLPISGTLVLDAHMNSTGLAAPGVYTTTLILETDTPYDPISLPITLIINDWQNVYLPLLVNLARE